MKSHLVAVHAHPWMEKTNGAATKTNAGRGNRRLLDNFGEEEIKVLQLLNYSPVSIYKLFLLNSLKLKKVVINNKFVKEVFNFLRLPLKFISPN